MLSSRKSCRSKSSVSAIERKVSVVIEPLYAPSQKQALLSRMGKYLKKKNFQNYNELWHWSVENKEDFWTDLFTEFSLLYSGDLTPALLQQNDPWHPYGWFPNIKVNFSENLLHKGQDQDVAFLEIGQEHQTRETTYSELRTEVAKVQSYLKKLIDPGDVVAAYMPNIKETAVAMLATTGLGGVFTSTSCDFGSSSVIDRFSQSRPKVLFAPIEYVYGEKRICLKAPLKRNLRWY